MNERMCSFFEAIRDRKNVRLILRFLEVTRISFFLSLGREAWPRRSRVYTCVVIGLGKVFCYVWNALEISGGMSRTLVSDSYAHGD